MNVNERRTARVMPVTLNDRSIAKELFFLKSNGSQVDVVVLTAAAADSMGSTARLCPVSNETSLFNRFAIDFLSDSEPRRWAKLLSFALLCSMNFTLAL